MANGDCELQRQIWSQTSPSTSPGVESTLSGSVSDSSLDPGDEAWLDEDEALVDEDELLFQDPRVRFQYLRGCDARVTRRSNLLDFTGAKNGSKFLSEMGRRVV
jgi:hypothetical protein